ncbi:MAG TPA: hypothetical protein P5168_00575 [Candidatus Methanomethylicus sp.]|nr:hypothetical protein [Candidatus Methanomethylicus sp.]
MAEVISAQRIRRSEPPAVEVEGTGEGYSPGHITAFFSIHMTNDPMLTGSTGAGICLEEGVRTRVTLRPDRSGPSLSMKFNGKAVSDVPTCDYLVRAMSARIGGPICVSAEQESALPPNYGYGLSGASALSLALAINKAADLRLSMNEVGQFAHEAEVANLTGLGDVPAQLAGGVEVRVRPGAPGLGEVRRLPHPDGLAVVTAPVAMFPTRTMITAREYVARINLLGARAMSSFMDSPAIGNLMRQSRLFWQGVGIAEARMLATIRLFEGAGIACPSAKKGIVFGIVHRDELPAVAARLGYPSPAPDEPMPLVLGGKGINLIVTAIAKRGAL